MAKEPSKPKKRKALKVMTFAALKKIKKPAGAPVTASLPTANLIHVAPATTVNTVVLNNVPEAELDALLAELRADDRVISTQVIPEGDGEYTVIVQYRS